MDRDLEPQRNQHEWASPPQQMLTQLVNNLPGMAYRCQFDGQRTMTFVSEGCFELTGYHAAEIISSKFVNYDELILSDDRKSVELAIENATRDSGSFVITYRLKKYSGQELWVQESGRVVYAVDGSVKALEGFVMDHTESMRTKELLKKQSEDRTRKLSALYDILEVASDPSDLKTTINRSLLRVLKAIEGDAGAIHLFDKSGDVLQMVAQVNFPELAAAKYSQISVAEDPLFGWVARINQPLLIPNMDVDERAKDMARTIHLTAYIGVPIVANDLVRGVLTVLSDDLTRYSAKEEVELLSSVGEQLGVVVENFRLRLQAEQLMVLEERNRLARELHDSVTQSLYSLTLFAEAGMNLTNAGDFQRVGQMFIDISEIGQQALKEMRLLVHKLRPSILEKEGLVRALRHRLKAVEGRAGIKSRFTVKGPISLSAESEEALFHVAQEALNNALKHTHATEVNVTLNQYENGCLVLTVKDNGQGFDLVAAADGSGLGLISMRERVEKLGGTIQYDSQAGLGTKVLVQLPADCFELSE
ncbi:MAG: histidine kinase [Candidatus Promineifilaceae bacterium]|nr:histidine kinase [Candidatus Promineifilaceae bacterium]